MTESQERVFRYVFNFIQLMGYPPNHREISLGIKRSIGFININLKDLKKSGYIDYEIGKYKTLKILKVW